MADAATSAGPKAEGGPSVQGLAQKINHLFDTVRRPDGSMYSNDEVATQVSNLNPEGSISGNYIWMLRNGQRDNPTKKHLESLASFFDVGPAYFFDDSKSQVIATELAVLKAIKDGGVERIAMRLNGLTPQSLDAVKAVIESLRTAEGLPPHPAEDQDT